MDGTEGTGTEGKPAKKKKAAKKAAKKAVKKSIKKTKGGFGVFISHGLDRHPVSSDEIPITPFLEQVATDLKDTLDAERWIKENAENFKNEELVIAQVKKSVKVKVETQVKVTFE